MSLSLLAIIRNMYNDKHGIFSNRSSEDNKTRGKRVFQDKDKEQLNNVSVVKEVNKRNVKGEGHWPVRKNLI